MSRQIQFIILTIVFQVINSQDQQQISIGEIVGIGLSSSETQKILRSIPS